VGDRDGFFESMERSRLEGAEPVLELEYSPLFRSVRTDPRFVEFSKKWAERMVWHPEPLPGDTK
jgi:hypothetical protein